MTGSKKYEFIITWLPYVICTDNLNYTVFELKY